MVVVRVGLRVKIVFAVVASLSLVLGVVSPASAGGVPPQPSPAPNVAIPVGQVPPLPVDKGVVPTPSGSPAGTGAPATDLTSKPLVPPVDLKSSLSPSAAFDATTSVAVSRDAHGTLFRNKDGSKTRVLSPTPINFQRKDGTWVAAGTSIVANAVGGGFAVVDSPLNPSFAATSGRGADLTVDNGGGAVSMSLQGEAPVVAARPAASLLHSVEEGLGSNAGASKSSALQYSGVFPGQDLQYQVTASEVKETLVINAIPDAAQSSWSWLIHAPGLSLSQSDRGSLYLTDSAGVVQYSIPDPVMWDSSGVAEKAEPALTDVSFTFAQQSSGDWLLVLTPDRSWLTDPARQYPVLLDPTFSTGPTTEVSYENAGPTYANQGRMGNSRASSADTYWRTVACYPYDSLVPGQEITSGYLAYSYNGGTTTTQPGYINYATTFGYNGVGAGITTWSLGSGGGNTTDAGVPNQYQAWDNAGQTGSCLMLSGYEIPGSYTYKDENTALYLNYQAAPTATPAAPSPANGARASVMPTLAVSSNDPSGSAQNFTFYVSSSNSTNPQAAAVWSAATSGITSASAQVPNKALTPGTTYYWDAVVQDAYGAVRQGPVQSFVANTPGTISQTGSAPSDTSIITTLTPTLSVPAAGSDANGDSLTYQFRITTGIDGVTGQVASSVRGSALSWQVPAGILQDGTAYTWTVVVSDGYDNSWSWVNHIKTNLRVTDSGPAPTDSAGPVAVNLANGNVSASFTTKTVATVGGPLGMSFNYSSQAVSNAGLTGSYYSAVATGQTTPVFTFPPANPVLLQRTDPQLSFDWSTAPPVPGLPAQNFMAQWTGYITAPLSTSYTFGFLANDSAALYLNGSSTATLNQTSTTGNSVVWNSSATSMTAAPAKITVQYTDATSLAHLQLWVSYTDAGGHPVSEVVPGTWFTRTITTLPGGWAGSQALMGSSASFVSEQNNGGSIVFTDIGGATHTYTQATGGTGYTPPPGEQGVVSVASGVVNFTDPAGTVSVFGVAGQLLSTTSPADLTKPASPVPAYNNSGQITTLSDPLSREPDPIPMPVPPPAPIYDRQVQFTYATAVNGSGTGACAPPSGTSSTFEVPPIGYLCQISYPDASATNLYYDLNGQLAEVINPGGAVTNFQYTQAATGAYLLRAIRTPLVNDWMAFHGITTVSDTQSTTIGYDGQIPSRAIKVVLPAPDGATASSQPEKDYSYGTGTTGVTVAGLTVPNVAPSNGNARTVTYNSTMQTLTDASALGVTATTTWNSHDNPLTSINGQGYETSTLYDWQDRPTDSYGPALSTCFTGQVPGGACGVVPAHSKTTYDGGTGANSLAGLNVVYYSTSNLAGTPTAYALGVGSSDGTINKTWTSAPAPNVPLTNFSAELTGTITFPAAGTYTLTALADDYAQVYINDVLTVNTITSGVAASGTFTATAGQVARVRINYGQLTGAAALTFSWTPPGGSSVPVPAANLSANYGLVTSTHSDESVPTGVTGVTSSQVTASNTQTTYGPTPWLGQVASSTVDPGGLGLQSSATYETGATLYNRQLTSVKPAGAATTTTNSYYGATQSYGAALGITSAVCAVPVSIIQYGMLEQVTGPTAADGTQATTTYIYDTLGRVAGTKRNGDTSWSCVTYDTRGRPTSTYYSAAVGAAARTITSNYAVGGDPLTTTIGDDTSIPGSPSGDTLKTVSDLLGRTVSYTDVWGTVTSPTYESKTGRITSVSTLPVGGALSIESFQYDLDGKTTKVTVDGTVEATPAYGAPGQLLSSVAYGNGSSLSAITRNDAGATTGLTWSFPSSQPALSDAVTRAQSGRILKDTITDGAVADTSSLYSYDGAGRLTNASIAGNTLTYGYGTASCGANTNAGADGNRTSSSDTHAGATSSISYCYDNADRLTATNLTTPPTGANPVTGTNLAATGAVGATLAYDAHGNTTTLADQTLGYDSTDRHTSTTLADHTSVTYVRDVTDRIVQRTTATPATALTVDTQVSGDDTATSCTGP